MDRASSWDPRAMHPNGLAPEHPSKRRCRRDSRHQEPQLVFAVIHREPRSPPSRSPPSRRPRRLRWSVRQFRAAVGGSGSGRLGGTAMVSAAVIAAVNGVLAASPSTADAAGVRSGVRASHRTAAEGLRCLDASRGCSAGARSSGGPRVAFPSEGPARPTGDGAISWLSDPAPCGSRSGRRSVSVAALGSTDQAKLAGVQSLGSRAGTALAGIGASSRAHSARRRWRARRDRHRAAAGRRERPRLHGRGCASGPVLRFAVARAYLGDVAIAGVGPGSAITVRVERYFQSDFGRPRSIPIGPGAVTALDRCDGLSLRCARSPGSRTARYTRACCGHRDAPTPASGSGRAPPTRRSRRWSATTNTA